MTELHGFDLIQEREIPELNSQARLFRHLKTGAELLSVENNDENKVFGVTFRTPPSDSTGLPHIMEHAVLCGSRKYPVKEPFVELLKGSLQTFVNAWTFSDKTCYPLASQNLRDFYNLIDIYLDAVFYPNITPQVLQQEGWHYELDNPSDPLAYKGVVFNEMKGAYSDPDNLIGRYIQQTLFPDTPYGVDSGGDPAAIPDLTYEQFKRFHDAYYHPSNALLWFYGDDDPGERLRFVNKILTDFDRLDAQPVVPLQPPFEAPQKFVYSYAAGEGEGNKGILTVNWVLAEVTDPEMSLAFAILNHILIDTPASPLRKALIDSGLGEDLAGIGLDADIRQMVFSTGLKGIAVENADAVERLIVDMLSALAEQGIEQDMIEAAVNTVEFSLRENNTGSFPRGLLLMVWALRTWLYGADPMTPLAFEAPLAVIKEHLAAGEPYFEQLIRRYLVENPHRTTILMKPDSDHQQRLDAAEKERLTQARAVMSDADVQKVIEDMQALKRRQETPDTPEALATIPSLALEDLDKKNKLIPLEVLEAHGCPILYHDLFTNGIVYLDLGFDLHALPGEYLPYIGLFGRVLLEMGTETEDFVKLSQRIGRKTGGIEPGSLVSMVRNTSRSTAWQFLRAKSTVAQADDMLAILRDVLLTAKLDNQERFRQLVLEEKAGQEADLIPRGHLVIRSRLLAHLNEADWASEQMGGVDYLFFLRQLAKDVDQDWPAVLEKLEAIRARLVNRRAMICNVTLDADNWAGFEPKLSGFLASLPAAEPAPLAWTPHHSRVNEGLAIPAQVNYVGKGASLYALGYQFHGSLFPVLNYLRTTWLWERVRVHGGAYGAFCTFDHRSGALSFLSYRDPNVKNTLDSYDESGRFLHDLNLSDDELLKSIIGAIGTLDAYQLPDAKGYTSMARYLVGDTDAMRQQMRDEVLSTTQADFKRFAEVLDGVKDNGVVVVLGSPEAIAGANNDGWLQVTKVL